MGQADGEDAVQNALLKLLTAQGDLRPQSRRSWLRASLLHEKLHLHEEAATREKHAAEIEAHLREQAALLPLADAGCLLREVLAAVSWLLDQVQHPERRTVASWCIWRSLFAEQVGFDALAEELGIPRGTFATHWDRAKDDMRAALERERAKSRGRSKLAALFAALAAVWFWLVARGRRLAGAVAGGLRRSFPALSSAGRRSRAGAIAGCRATLAALARRGVDVRVRGAGPRVALACMGLPLAVLSHVPFDAALSSAEVFAASYEAISGEATREVHAVREVDRSMYGPILSTNAEREREWGSGRAPRAVSAVRAAAPSRQAGSSSAQVDSAARDFERRMLARVAAAIARGDLDMARDAIRAYDGATVDGMFDSERARLGALLSKVERSR